LKRVGYSYILTELSGRAVINSLLKEIFATTQMALETGNWHEQQFTVIIKFITDIKL